MHKHEIIGWGSTRVTFARKEFDYIYNIVESPIRRDLVSTFDTVWNWEGLGDSMRSHPESLLRWIHKITCAVEVHGRNQDVVFDAVWGLLTEHTYETITTKTT